MSSSNILEKNTNHKYRMDRNGERDSQRMPQIKKKKHGREVFRFWEDHAHFLNIEQPKETVTPTTSTMD